MRPLSGRILMLAFMIYTVACVALGIWVHRGFYVALVALPFAHPILREFRFVADRDEWQVAVSHRSSHVAFLVAMGIAAAAFLKSGIVDDEGPLGIVSLVLFVPLVVKVAVWQLTGRGRRRTGLVLGFAIGGFWFLFSVLAGDFNPQLIVGGIPLLAAFLALRWQRLGGVILLLCGAATAYFFVLAAETPALTQLFVALMLPTPLILAGVLLVMRRGDGDDDWSNEVGEGRTDERDGAANGRGGV